MSKLHDPEDSVGMRLLGDGLDGSTVTVVGEEDGDHWASHADPRLLSLTSSRSPSPESYFAHLRRRRVFLRVFYGTLLVTIASLVIYVSRKPIVERVQSWRGPPQAPVTLDEQSSLTLNAIHDHSLYVAGPPATRFRDNLVDGTKYVTAWPIGGFTNEVMSQISLIYLAILALRIPVLPDFVPGHMHGNPGPIPISEVYDLPRLADSLHIPILEWREFKNRSKQETEKIGCWSPHMTIFKVAGHYGSEREFGLDISATPVPDSRFAGDRANTQNIMALAALGWPEQRARALQNNKPVPSPGSQEIIPPDETMLCFDELFYADSVRAYEWDEAWVPMWTQVGTYMRWEPKMEDLARSYILRAFGLGASDPFPSYISVHIRHTDFAQICHGHNDGSGNCFQPLSSYEEKINEVKAELLAQHGEKIDRVLVTSDEEDEDWWASVTEQGWHRIDWKAEKTEEQYSEWYPIILDSVALSLGKGFVGTTRSTLSRLASKRVMDWERGPVRMVTYQ